MEKNHQQQLMRGVDMIGTKSHINTNNQDLFPPSTPISAVFKSFLDHEKTLGILNESTIKAHTTRLIGENNNGPILIACRNSGLKCVGDIATAEFRLINKEIEKISSTRAQANNLKSSFTKALKCSCLLGNIMLPTGTIRGVRQQKNRPCAPKQLSDAKVAYFLESKKGRTPFLAARNDLIGEIELRYALRPGKEVTMIDDANVHPLEGFMDVLRDDGLMQRIYLSRDTCDRIIKYRQLRQITIKNSGDTEPVIPFFIKERVK
jgi:hypothetical protein